MMVKAGGVKTNVSVKNAWHFYFSMLHRVKVDLIPVAKLNIIICMRNKNLHFERVFRSYVHVYNSFLVLDDSSHALTGKPSFKIFQTEPVRLKVK